MAHRKNQRRHVKTRNHSSKRIGNCPVGILEMNHAGYGFVDTDEGSFYIPANRTGTAMNGDLVEVRPRHTKPQPGHRREGVVARIHKRALEYVVGVLDVNDPLAAVVPQDPRIQHDIFVDIKQRPDAHDGDVVLARITNYPTKRMAATGYIVEVLGSKELPGIDVDIIIHNHGLETEFNPQALLQAEKIETDIEGALSERGRHDLRMRDVFTIDPVDAKDFDDAISLEHVDGLTRLGVHIADVTSYVEWDSSIDICARDRATSVYLVDRVLPMLPERLSNDICSLKPGCDRRAFTCDMYFDDDGNLKKYQLHTSVICSKRRFNYDEVQSMLEQAGVAENTGPESNSADAPTHDPYLSKLIEFHALTRKILQKRNERGALDFDAPEAKPILDEEGNVERIDLRVKNDAASMIEEAMIAANECVAGHLFRKKRPCVYRIHESPRPKSLEALLPVLKQLGYRIQGLGSGNPLRYQELLEQARMRPEGDLVDSMVLRSMERARYSTQPLKHFGLASTHYCHFTSPIRRYPDLMVHRLLKDACSMEGQLDWLAEHASIMERKAEAAERDSINLKICEYMSNHVGESFIGTISTVHAHGFFVRLDNTAEGFVSFDPVKHEHHEFDPKMQTLVGEETGRTYRLGQRIKVVLKSVDLRDQTIDFCLQ